MSREYVVARNRCGTMVLAGVLLLVQTASAVTVVDGTVVRRVMLSVRLGRRLRIVGRLRSYRCDQLGRCD
jgi:hypothetical protein